MKYIIPQFHVPHPVEQRTDDDLLVLDRLTRAAFFPDDREDEEAAPGCDAFVEDDPNFVVRRGKRQNGKN